MKHKMIISALIFVIVMMLSLLLSACGSAVPRRCTASRAVDVYAYVPNPHDERTVDRLEENESAIVTANVDGWYEITTARLVSGYVDSGICR